MTTVVIPCFDTVETIESLRAATRNGLEGQLADLLGLMDYYTEHGWTDVRTSTLERRMQDFDELRAKAELYQGILGTTINDLTEKLGLCAERVTKDLTKREEDDAAKAEELAKEKEEKKAAKAKEREEKKAAAKAAKTAEKPAKTRKGRKASETTATVTA